MSTWVVIGVAVWMLASVLLAVIVGRIVDHADARARTDHIDPVEVPAAWLDELVDH